MIDINGWQEIKLGQMGKFSTSSVDKKSIEGQKQVSLVNYMDVYSGNTIDSNIKLMKVSASVVERTRSQVFRGDILFTPSSETPEDIGYSAVVGEELTDTLHSYHTVRLRPNSNMLDIRFSAWFANAEGVRKQFSQKCAGSTRYILSIPSFQSVKCKIPISLTVQRKIANCLDTVQTTIEKTEALIHKNQQIKAGLMHDLFTRGVTADGKLRLPREQASELYKETPIGWIPKEWHLVRASDICHPITKGTTPSNFINNSSKRDSIPYIRVENLSFNGSLQFDKDSLFVSKIIHNFELARSRVFVGDILMNIVGPPLGKVSLITDKYEEWNTNQAVAIFRVLHQRYRTYLLYYLLSDFAQKWFYLRSKQTSGQVNLTLEMCSNLEIPLPKNEAELTSISNTLARIFDKINTENTFRKKLLKKKSGLMHDLLTGKVPVKIDHEETAHV
jgi:type I restriction enzyme S subunit